VLLTACVYVVGVLVGVYALSWFDVPAGRVMIYGSPVIAVFLVTGWFAVRGRIRALAADRPDS
jgi:L-asparagine permease